MRYNIAYKVVCKKDGKFVSINATSPFLEGKEALSCLILEYGVNKTTIPEFGKLFVFENKARAIQYKHSPEYAVIKGYVTNPTIGKTRLNVGIPEFSNCTTLENFWNRTNGATRYLFYKTEDVPYNTLFCDSFTGLEIIKS